MNACHAVVISHPLGSRGGSFAPGRERLDDRVLDGVLGRREISAATDEDVQDLGCQRPQQRRIDATVPLTSSVTSVRLTR